MRNEVLARRVYELKETQRGIDVMCKEMDEIYREGIEIGEQRGIEIGEQIGEQRGIEIGEQIGEQRGRRRGEENVIGKFIDSNLKEGSTIDQIKEKLVRYFSLTAQQAAAYAQQFGKQI